MQVIQYKKKRKYKSVSAHFHNTNQKNNFSMFAVAISNEEDFSKYRLSDKVKGNL